MAYKNGAPRYIISAESLNRFIESGFTSVQIADMLNVGVSTVIRRIKEFGFSLSKRYTDITPEDLDESVSEILRDFPNSGYKKMKGFLTGRGIVIQEERIRDSMRRVDPEGVILRALQAKHIVRRKYQVPGPLSLWHIDGNHKLIRYNEK